MSARWPVRELAGEAWRNLRASPVATLLVVLVVVAGVAAGTVLEASEARRGRAQLAARARDGGWVTVARAGGVIDARACRHLAHQRDVRAAGGVEKPRTVAVSSAPGTLFEAYGATPEFIDVLVAAPLATAARAGVVAVGPALATELGLIDGSHVVVGAAGYEVVVLPRSVRADRFTRALVIPELPSDVAECWVEWAPGAQDTRTLTESLIAANGSLTVSAMLTSSAYSRDPLAQYRDRWTRWWFVAAGLFAALVMAITLRARRRALALYTAVGASRAELTVLVACEALVIAGLGTSAGVAWGLAVFARGGELTSFDVGAALGPAGFVAACLLVLTVAVVGTRRFNVAHELKAD